MQILKIPKERIAVLIGREGKTKKKIEESTGVRINIDSETGEIEINAQEPLAELKGIDIIRAVGRGFSPENALKLLNDDFYFEVIDIKEYAGKSQKHISRLKSRVIGTGGKTRRLIEELTNAKVSIYGNTVSVIGEYEPVSIAKAAVDMLLTGSEHSTVYRYLERMRKAGLRTGMGV